MGDFDLLIAELPRAPRYTVALPPPGAASGFELEILDDEGARILRLVVEPGRPLVMKRAAEYASAPAP